MLDNSKTITIKVKAFDGADGYDGINIYDLDDNLIDQIPYDMSLATEEAGYDHIVQASKQLHEQYDVIETDDIVLNRE